MIDAVVFWVSALLLLAGAGLLLAVPRTVHAGVVLFCEIAILFVVVLYQGVHAAALILFVPHLTGLVLLWYWKGRRVEGSADVEGFSIVPFIAGLVFLYLVGRFGREQFVSAHLFWATGGSLGHYLLLSLLLFGVGFLGLFLRPSPVRRLMSLQVLFGGPLLCLVSYSTFRNHSLPLLMLVAGQCFVLLVTALGLSRAEQRSGEVMTG